MTISACLNESAALVLALLRIHWSLCSPSKVWVGLGRTSTLTFYPPIGMDPTRGCKRSGLAWAPEASALGHSGWSNVRHQIVDASRATRTWVVDVPEWPEPERWHIQSDLNPSRWHSRLTWTWALTHPEQLEPESLTFLSLGVDVFRLTRTWVVDTSSSGLLLYI